MGRGRVKSAIQTECYKEIEKEGSLNTTQLLSVLNKSRRLNSTANEISQMLVKSPLFEKIGVERIADITGRYYDVAVWDNLPLEEVAKKWLSVKHPLRRRDCLPAIMRDEIERLEEQT